MYCYRSGKSLLVSGGNFRRTASTKPGEWEKVSAKMQGMDASRIPYKNSVEDAFFRKHLFVYLMGWIIIDCRGCPRESLRVAGTVA